MAPAPRLADGVPYGLLAVLLAAVAGAAAGAATAGGPLTAAAGAGGGRAGRRRRRAGRVGVGYVTLALPDRAPPAGAGVASVLLPLALVAPVGYLMALSVAG